MTKTVEERIAEVRKSLNLGPDDQVVYCHETDAIRAVITMRRDNDYSDESSDDSDDSGPDLAA